MVLDRKARCLLFMKKWAKARKAFEDCLEAVKEVKNLDEKMRECFIAQVETHLGKIPTDTMIEVDTYIIFFFVKKMFTINSCLLLILDLFLCSFVKSFFISQ